MPLKFPTRGSLELAARLGQRVVALALISPACAANKQRAASEPAPEPTVAPAGPELDAIPARFRTDAGNNPGSSVVASMIIGLKLRQELRPIRGLQLCTTGGSPHPSPRADQALYSPAYAFDDWALCVPITGTFQEGAVPRCPPSPLDPGCVDVIRRSRADQEFRAHVTLAPDGEPTAVRLEPASKNSPAEEARATLCILKQLSGRYLLSLSPCEP